MSYTDYIANIEAEADAWMAEHAHLLGDVDAEGDSRHLEYGAEYFDTDSLDADYDDMDYYERMGIKAVSESKRTAYVDTGVKGASPRQPRDIGHNDGHVRFLAPVSAPARDLNEVANGHWRSLESMEVLPYRGQPVSHYSPACKRASGRAQHITEQKQLADMANKDAQKVRRYAKKHQVTISTAIDALRTAGKID